MARLIVLILGLVFFSVGIIIVGLREYVRNSFVEFKKTAHTTTGYISSIKVYYSKDYKEEHSVFVEYTVDGQVYEKELNYYDSSMYEGQSMEIYYNPEHPGDSRIEEGHFGIFHIVGILFSVLGMIFISYCIIHRIKIYRILKHGICVKGTIIDIIPDTNVIIWGKYPNKIDVEYIDSKTGAKYLYRSDSTINKSVQIVGATVNVYVNPQDESEYYVDLKSVKEMKNNRVSGLYDFR